MQDNSSWLPFTEYLLLTACEPRAFLEPSNDGKGKRGKWECNKIAMILSRDLKCCCLHDPSCILPHCTENLFNVLMKYEHGDLSGLLFMPCFIPSLYRQTKF